MRGPPALQPLLSRCPCSSRSTWCGVTRLAGPSAAAVMASTLGTRPLTLCGCWQRTGGLLSCRSHVPALSSCTLVVAVRHHTTNEQTGTAEASGAAPARDANANRASSSPADAQGVEEKPSVDQGNDVGTTKGSNGQPVDENKRGTSTPNPPASSTKETADATVPEALNRQEEGLDEVDEDGDENETEADDDGAKGVASSGQYVTDHQRRLQYEKKVKHAERLMGLQEIVSKEGLQKSLKFTNVSTTAGVHWQDVSPLKSLSDRPGFRTQPEGFFAHSVISALFGKNLAPELSAFVMDGNPLPHVVVGPNWWGLTLRVSHDGAAAVQLTSLVELDDASGIRESELARVRNLEAFYGAAPSVENEVDTYANELFGAMPAEHAQRETGYDEVTNTFNTRRVPSRSHWSRLKALFVSARQTSRGDRARTTQTKKRARAGSRRPPSAQSTLKHFSTKLTIVVVREPHPLEAVLAPQPTPVADTAKHGVGGWSEADNEEDTDETLWSKTEKARAERRGTRLPYDPNNPTADTDTATAETAAAATTAQDAGGAVRASSHKPVRPRKPLTRFRVVSIHQHPIPFLDAAFANWPTLATSKFVAPLGVPAVHTVQDVVRLMVRGAVTSFREDAYRATRQMERIESLIYDTDPNIGAHRKTVAHTMAHLHVMSRRARAQEMILRDTQMAAMRLRALKPAAETTRDAQDQAFMSRCISLATHLEEHTESLLFLQFQVVSSELAENLRTLTIFSTFFIPINFIFDIFSMSFDGLIEWCNQEDSIYVFAGLLLVTTLAMARFVQRHIQV